ncbi:MULTISPECIES: molybdopterin synthase sulfur carrier subunit [unclassified Vibrio]|uniref:Molybdopterin synthase sulfur carrier subunit n=1 Tax=Vibrio sp. HB236076 TaxID=3232307 RepID=A0AB39H8K1_9VIBR|nr:molybdopterin synthase sulfur carrier subunit [Vibrio sp. HB161653]MDP5253730.1 molybdopterin synthase sulfur carrier subunit [Vibrio sp. HB161653]
MIHVHFFAQTRELIGEARIEVEPSFESVEALRAQLASQGDKWALALEQQRVLAAVNQTLVSLEHPLCDGDEVAFFPPVTGG